jgi:hypothetical protein
MSFPGFLAAADRAVQKHLGGRVLYRTRYGAEVEVPGVFDAAYVKAAAGELGVESSSPAVFLLLEDLPRDPEDDDPRITVDGVGYVVAERQKDGMGGVLLLLHRA